MHTGVCACVIKSYLKMDISLMCSPEVEKQRRRNANTLNRVFTKVLVQRGADVQSSFFFFPPPSLAAKHKQSNENNLLNQG